MKKSEIIRISIAGIIVTGFIFSALCLFDIINMDAIPIVLLVSAILSISNGYYYTKNKKMSILSILGGLFLIFVFVFKILF